MPTYKFRCDNCKREWEERQSLLLDGTKHTSTCPDCNKKHVESIPSGGTGVLLKGRRMDKYVEGFPDFTRNKNKEADKEGEELEQLHDAYIREQTKDDDEKS